MWHVSREFVEEQVFFSITDNEADKEGSNGHAGHKDSKQADDDESKPIVSARCSVGQGAVLAEDAAHASGSGRTVKNVHIFWWFKIFQLFIIFCSLMKLHFSLLNWETSEKMHIYVLRSG